MKGDFKMMKLSEKMYGELAEFLTKERAMTDAEKETRYNEVEDFSEINTEYLYCEGAHYIRCSLKCYKSEAKENASIEEILNTLEDVSDRYNFISTSDSKYIDGFVFPQDMIINEGDTDNVAANIITIEDDDDNGIMINNRLKKKISFEQFKIIMAYLAEFTREIK